MLDANLWRSIPTVDRATVIESVEESEEVDALVVHVRPRRPTKCRCGRCGVRSPGYDRGEGRHRWRCLDLGSVVLLECRTLRVLWPERAGLARRRCHPRDLARPTRDQHSRHNVQFGR